MTPFVLSAALISGCNSNKDIPKHDINPAPAVKHDQGSNGQHIQEIIIIGPDGKRVPTQIEQGNSRQTITGGGLKIELEVKQSDK